MATPRTGSMTGASIPSRPRRRSPGWRRFSFRICRRPRGVPGPSLARGSKGDAVVRLQNFLRDLDFAVAVDVPSGPGTEVAATRLESEHGLTADGMIGPETWAAMDLAKKAG